MDIMAKLRLLSRRPTLLTIVVIWIIQGAILSLGFAGDTYKTQAHFTNVAGMLCLSSQFILLIFTASLWGAHKAIARGILIGLVSFDIMATCFFMSVGLYLCSIDCSG